MMKIIRCHDSYDADLLYMYELSINNNFLTSHLQELLLIYDNVRFFLSSPQIPFPKNLLSFAHRKEYWGNVKKSNTVINK